MRRIAAGQPLYGPPTLEFVPPLYSPLYFYVSALVAQAIGLGLPTLRLVSLVASLGSAMLIAHLVWRETHSMVPAAGAAAVFLGTTQLSSNVLDAARTDAFALFLVLAAVTCARTADLRPRSAAWWSVASGALTALAILTKQTTAVMVLALTLHALLSGRPLRVAAYFLGLASVVGLGALMLATFSGGWAWLYLVELPRQHRIETVRLFQFWTEDVAPNFSLALAVGPLFLIGSALRRDWSAVRFWAVVPAGVLAVAWGSRLNVGSVSNVAAPAYAILAALFGLGIGELLRVVDRRPQVPGVYRVYVLGLIALQLVLVQYNPRHGSPLRSDVWAGDRMHSTVASLPGTVFAPQYPEFGTLAGKNDQAFATNIMELMGSFGGGTRPEGTMWMEQYARALQARQYDMLLLDPEYAGFLKAAAASNGYIERGPLFEPGDPFTQWQGPNLQNPRVWVPRERAN